MGFLETKWKAKRCIGVLVFAGFAVVVCIPCMIFADGASNGLAGSVTAPLAQVLEEVPEKANESRGLRADDSDAYFATLEFLRTASIPELQVEAAANLARREAEHDKRLPHLRYSQFADLLNNPKWWQGKAIRLIGHANRIVTYDSGENDHDISSLYESWVVTDSSLQYPTTVVSLEIPDGVAIGEAESVGVDVTGVFFQLFTYKARDGETRYAPLVLAKRWDHPAAKQASRESWWLAALALLFGLTSSMTLLRMAKRKPRRRVATPASDLFGNDENDGQDTLHDAPAPEN